LKISVKVKAGAKQERVQKLSPQEYNLWVKAPAKQGLANQAVIALLSGYLSTPKSCITILKGRSCARKIIEIML